MLAWLRRLVAATGRAIGWPTREGRWIEGVASSARGIVAIAPLVAPRRQFLLYIPRGYTRWRRAPLLVMCHGCRQQPEEFARGTRIAGFADAHRTLVLMPRQRDDANAWRCWNWFDGGTAAGAGEAAIVAAMTRKVLRTHAIDAARVRAAGMSAGGALAAILGVRHAATFRAVVVHSGIACGAATTPYAAQRVMANGPEADVEAIGRHAHRDSLRVPILVIQGLDDKVVAGRNATALVAQYLALAGEPADTAPRDRAAADATPAHAGGARPGAALRAASSDQAIVTGAHAIRMRDWRDAQGTLARLVEIEGLGHAWSGGDAVLPYNDPDSPDALVLIRDWMRELDAARRTTPRS